MICYRRFLEVTNTYGVSAKSFKLGQLSTSTCEPIHARQSMFPASFPNQSKNFLDSWAGNLVLWITLHLITAISQIYGNQRWDSSHLTLLTFPFSTIVCHSGNMITVRIAHLRIAHWGAILRWAILSPSVIRIAHLNYYVFYALFALDMGPGWVLGTRPCIPS